MIRKTILTLALLMTIPLAVLIYGFAQTAGDSSGAESPPERIAHRDQVFAECLDGATAAPDRLYCEQMADLTIAYFTDEGLNQQALHKGTFGLVPAWYHTPTPFEEMGARREAEYLAQLSGADGSTRFTGENLAEVEAKLEVLQIEWEKELGIHDAAQEVRAAAASRPGAETNE